MKSLKKRVTKLLSAVMIGATLLTAGTTVTALAESSYEVNEDGKAWIRDILHFDYGVKYSDMAWSDEFTDKPILTIHMTEDDKLTLENSGHVDIPMEKFSCTYENDSCMTTKTLVRRALIRAELIEE